MNRSTLCALLVILSTFTVTRQSLSRVGRKRARTSKKTSAVIITLPTSGLSETASGRSWRRMVRGTTRPISALVSGIDWRKHL